MRPRFVLAAKARIFCFSSVRLVSLDSNRLGKGSCGRSSCRAESEEAEVVLRVVAVFCT